MLFPLLSYLIQLVKHVSLRHICNNHVIKEAAPFGNGLLFTKKLKLTLYLCSSINS
jgi:hypothetical protein